jgi:arylsulfatase A-like enzyme
VVAGPEYLARYPDLPEEQQHLYGCITAKDEQIGRLRTFLRDRGVAENTILLFCSDNGPADGLTRRGVASAGPFRGHKHTMWEGGLRVPSLIEWPGRIEAGQTSGFPASTVDYLPTILDMLGLPAFKKVPLDGISLLPVLTGTAAQRSVPIASGYQRLYQDKEFYAFTDGRYKICIPEPGFEMQLFDLKTDPGETNNLAAERPDLLRAMSAKLEKIKQSWKESREGKDYKW